jgi:hypothetical protein
VDRLHLPGHLRLDGHVLAGGRLADLVDVHRHVRDDGREHRDGRRRHLRRPALLPAAAVAPRPDRQRRRDRDGHRRPGPAGGPGCLLNLGGRSRRGRPILSSWSRVHHSLS